LFHHCFLFVALIFSSCLPLFYSHVF
jgi:hypothetical protein